MRRTPAPLNHIRAFESAARHLSFTRAARELGLTQAAISHQVRALEAHLGLPLFHRRARSLRLTDAGAAFLPALRHALEQIDDAAEAVAAVAKERSIGLACPMSLAENWLPGRLSDFMASNPDIDVVLHGTVWETRDPPPVDLIISMERLDDRPDGADPLWSERLALVCSPAFAERVTSARDVANLPKIHVLGRLEMWTEMASALGIGAIDVSKGLHANASNIALELAARGLGLAVCFASLTAVYRERGLLVEPLSRNPASPWTYCLRRSGGGRRRAAERLRAWLLDGRCPCGPAVNLS
jgi:DNA-binding transcriptional LysR family regulator